LPIFLALAVSSSAQQSELGEFEAQSDVGDVRHKGSVRFDAAKKEYQINASGENMWQDKDALHFVCRRLSGDSSQDGKWLAIGHEAGDTSLIYILPATGGEPKQVTSQGPSYWHSWSPDGKTLVYCAERQGEFDVYAISPQEASAGKERRLTDSPGLDDGLDYFPDGQNIYFNSERSGRMKVWRTKADGRDPQQVTFDDQFVDWFPHPSPDGKWLVFLSYDKTVQGHPPNKDVALRIMPLSGDEPKVLPRLFGGQGTINVPSWSPDSKSFAFVSYRLVKR
jgi:TolB protein